MSKEALDYAAECEFEAGLVAVQSDNQFLKDLHLVRAWFAQQEANNGAD